MDRLLHCLLFVLFSCCRVLSLLGAISCSGNAGAPGSCVTHASSSCIVAYATSRVAEWDVARSIASSGRSCARSWAQLPAKWVILITHMPLVDTPYLFKFEFYQLFTIIFND